MLNFENFRPFILDGGMGSQLSQLGMGDARCPEELLLLEPQKVFHVHEKYFNAGSNAVETNTFGGSRLKLAEFGLADKTYEINFKAAQIAREASKLTNGFVAGSVGPSGVLLSKNEENFQFQDLRNIFREQIEALIDGGVDLLSIETQQDILETKCAVLGAKDAFRSKNKKVPTITHVTLDTFGRMLLGTQIDAVNAILDSLDVDAIGLNCSTGPSEMVNTIKYLSEHTKRKISIMPNAGIPINKDGKAVFPLGPSEFAEIVAKLVFDYKIDIVGGCCGTTPDHIKALSENLKKLKLESRSFSFVPSIASSLKSISLKQEPRPLIIGERLNSQGSKKMQTAVASILEKNSFSDVKKIAKEQIDSGSHALDLCLARKDKQEEKMLMSKVVSELRLYSEIPLVIDTIDYEVAKTAFENYSGKCIWNSINLEHGEDEFRKKLKLAKEFGVAAVFLCIDEKGLAKTKVRKLEIAERMLKIAAEYDYDRTDILFDFLTFSLATGQDEFKNSAIETLNAIEEFSLSHFRSGTSLGVSNVSFGLKPNQRRILNSIFTFHAVKKGLTAAIINAKEIIPYNEIEEQIRTAAEDLIFNRNDKALHNYIELVPAEGVVQVQTKAIDYTQMHPCEALKEKILRRDFEDLDSLLSSALNVKASAEVMNDLLDAMKIVGDRFARGELILPYVLESAEIMRKLSDYLMEQNKGEKTQSKGKMLLATVYGDIHDIGKNLVKSIVENNGFDVVDLGKNITANEILEKIKTEKPDALGLSALLVSTSNEMQSIAEQMHSHNLNIPVMIGGAAVDETFANSIAKKVNFKFPVFYCKDAFGGLNVVKNVSDKVKSSEFILNHISKQKNAVIGNTSTVVHSSAKISDSSKIHIHDFKQTIKLCRELRLEDKNKIFEKYKDYECFDIIEAKYIYGVFSARKSTVSNNLEIYNSDNQIVANLKFDFYKDKVPLSHYYSEESFAPIALFGLTVGEKFDILSTDEFTKKHYKHGLELHALKAEAAEKLADFVQKEIEDFLKIDFGRRYSPGYPAWHEMSEQTKMFEVLALDRIGLKLTSHFQMIPEASVTGCFIPSKFAKY